MHFTAETCTNAYFVKTQVLLNGKQQQIQRSMHEIHPFSDYAVESNGIFKSISDKKEYKYVKLDNGFQALLISDPKDAKVVVASKLEDGFRKSRNSVRQSSVNSEASSSEEGENNCRMSAGCLCIRVGSFEDPDSLPGLAHLLEHCVTMGSKKYPKENVFDDFLSSCGGYRNAETENEQTLFMFETVKEYFHEALNIFASFFVNPLLKKSSVAKEIEPVDAEFVEASCYDGTRLELLMQSFIKNGHPLRKFRWGNKDTLVDIPAMNIKLHEALNDFRKKHYVAENMAFVIQTEDNLETLTEWVIDTFSSVSSTKCLKVSTPTPPNGSPFGAQFSKLYYAKPIQKCNRLIISWWVPCTRAFYKTMPLYYLGSIIDDEGKGSLLSFLRNEELAVEIAAGNVDHTFHRNIYQHLFSIEIELTEKGITMIGTVVNYVFAFIEMLQEKGPQKYLFDEQMLIEWNHFRFADDTQSLDETVRLAKRFFHYPIEHILIRDLPMEFNEKVIMDCLQHLKRTEPNIMVLRHDEAFQSCNAAVHRERWTGLEYKCCDVPNEWMLSSKKDPNVIFKGKVCFPSPNNFIATDFTLFTPKTKKQYPYPIYHNDCSRLWYKGDYKFNRPKAFISFIFTPAATMDIEQTVALDLFIHILNQNLKIDLYPAYMAGLRYEFEYRTGENQVFLRVYGFNHKLPNLIDLIVDNMVNFNVDDIVFKIMKKEIEKSYFKSLLDSKFLTFALTMSILEQHYFMYFEKLKYVADLKMEKLIETVKLFFGSLFTECLIQGNVTPKESEDILKRVVSRVRKPITFSLKHPQICEVPKGEYILRVPTFNNEERSSVITNYYQIGPCDIRQFCLLDLLSSAMNEPVFNTLRTNEGLGYRVCNGSLHFWGIAAFYISVISPTEKFSCDHVNERIENFLRVFGKTIENMEESFFEKLVRSRINAKSLPDLDLYEESDRNFEEMSTRNYCFDRLKREIACLTEISMKEFQRWSLHHILALSSRRKLSIQIIGNENNKNIETEEMGDRKDKIFDLRYQATDNGQHFITDIATFRQSLKQFPPTFVKS